MYIIKDSTIHIENMLISGMVVPGSYGVLFGFPSHIWELVKEHIKPFMANKVYEVEDNYVWCSFSWHRPVDDFDANPTPVLLVDNGRDQALVAETKAISDVPIVINYYVNEYFRTNVRATKIDLMPHKIALKNAWEGLPGFGQEYPDE